MHLDGRPRVNAATCGGHFPTASGWIAAPESTIILVVFPVETGGQLTFLHAAMSAIHPRSPLCQLPAGAMGRICAIEGDEGFCQRLREMGFGEAALVTKISGRTTSLCEVNGTRIALNHGAAMSILVEQLPSGAR